MRRFVPLFVFALLLITEASWAQSKAGDLLPRDLELELALSALPPYLRAEATAYALEKDGYVVAQQGTNGFSCLARRKGVTPGRFHRSFMTVCYDAEGSATLLQSDLAQAALFAEGKTHEQVADIIQQRWDDGTYRKPAHGIAYMLSPLQHITFIGQEPGSYIPHLMFFAPGHKAQAVTGTTPPNPMGYYPYVAVPGNPYTMIIVPMAPSVREELKEEHKALLDKMAPYVANS